jgi:hypothetical protein
MHACGILSPLTDDDGVICIANHLGRTVQARFHLALEPCVEHVV